MLFSALTFKFDESKRDEPFSLVEDGAFASHLGASDEGASDLVPFWADLLTDDALAELQKPEQEEQEAGSGTAAEQTKSKPDPAA